MNIIEFDDELDDDAKLLMLFALHNVKEAIKIDEADKPMIVIALNRDDINTVSIEDGGLVIGYHGDNWDQYE